MENIKKNNVCPFEIDGALVVRTSSGYKSITGHLYPIVRGIPRFVESEGYAMNFGKQWKKHRETQLDSYTKTNISEQRLEKSLGFPLEQIKGKRILEVGSGAGRFTEVLLKYKADVYSFDLSNAVEANYVNNKDKGSLTLFQADIYNIPLKKLSFDYVVCLGVIQHTPDTEKSISNLLDYVKPGGKLVFDHYRRAQGQFTSLYLFYWSIIKRLPSRLQLKVTNKLTGLFFPIHWKYKDSALIQKLLRRISPINFYYGRFDLPTKDLHYEWSMLDTHDRNTDYYKRNITRKKLIKYFNRMNVKKYSLEKGGTGFLCRVEK